MILLTSVNLAFRRRVALDGSSSTQDPRALTRTGMQKFREVRSKLHLKASVHAVQFRRLCIVTKPANPHVSTLPMSHV